jgi:hypothetical protein
MREARRASQRSANYFRKSARVANPRAHSERNVNGEVEPVQPLIAASAAIRRNLCRSRLNRNRMNRMSNPEVLLVSHPVNPVHPVNFFLSGHRSKGAREFQRRFVGRAARRAGHHVAARSALADRATELLLHVPEAACATTPAASTRSRLRTEYNDEIQGC